jgi:HEAT repeat protein
MKPEQHLETIFRADRDLREAETNLLSGDDKSIISALARAVDAAAKLDDRSEASMRLERLADLCAQVEGPEMADALLTILNDDDPAVRVAAGEALLDVGYDRYAEVARAVERWMTKGTEGPALGEIPWVLAEIGEPSALGLIKKFLKHPDVEVVASAIEALATLADPEAIEALGELVDDSREVTLFDGELESTATIGELAEDAIETLGGGETDGNVN